MMGPWEFRLTWLDVIALSVIGIVVVVALVMCHIQ
jgi:hypothetical protein